MKPKLVISCAVAALCLMQMASALAKPDFSDGTGLLASSPIHGAFGAPSGKAELAKARPLKPAEAG